MAGVRVWRAECGCVGKRFRGGLVVKAHRLVYHSNLGLRVIKKKKKKKKKKGCSSGDLA